MAAIFNGKTFRSGPITGVITSETATDTGITCDYTVTELRLTQDEFTRLSPEERERWAPLVRIVEVSEFKPDTD